MAKKFFIIIALMCVCVGGAAKRISETCAQDKAIRFARNNPGLSTRSGGAVTLAYRSDNFYVYNFTNGGFVIVSGSDLTVDVLGYSRTGSFNKRNIPENMADFLQGYNDQIEYAEKNNITNKSQKTRSDNDTKANIKPLVKSQWDQDYPYNAYCPEIDGNTAPTGCGATVMAQIIAYHRSNTVPTGTVNIPESDGILVPLELSLDTCGINYENLCIRYTGDETPEQIHEIAKLMKVCGYTMKSKYKAHSTSSWVLAPIEYVADYFDYNKADAKYIERKFYDTEDAWENAIYNSIKNSNPVIYIGYAGSWSLGHSWICDGYEDGFFHMNWGWGGYADGYYKLNALNIFDKNVDDQYAIINLHPNTINNDKTSDNLNAGIKFIADKTNFNIEWVNKSIYSGKVKYGYMAINEQSDTIMTEPKEIMIESGDSIAISNSVHDLNLEPGVFTVIPVVYKNDDVKRITESDIYAAVTPYESMLTKQKETIQPFLDNIYSKNFKLSKLRDLKISMEAVNPSYPVMIFNFTGQLVYNGKESDITLPKADHYTLKHGKIVKTFIIK